MMEDVLTEILRKLPQKIEYLSILTLNTSRAFPTPVVLLSIEGRRLLGKCPLKFGWSHVADTGSGRDPGQIDLAGPACPPCCWYRPHKRMRHGDIHSSNII